MFNTTRKRSSFNKELCEINYIRSKHQHIWPIRQSNNHFWVADKKVQHEEVLKRHNSTETNKTILHHSRNPHKPHEVRRLKTQRCSSFPLASNRLDPGNFNFAWSHNNFAHISVLNVPKTYAINSRKCWNIIAHFHKILFPAYARECTYQHTKLKNADA